MKRNSKKGGGPTSPGAAAAAAHSRAVVRVKRRPDGSLGFLVRGGLERNVLPHVEITDTRHKLDLNEGDVLLSINGRNVTNLPLVDIRAIIEAAGPVFPVEVVRGLKGWCELHVKFNFKKSKRVIIIIINKFMKE